MKPLSSLLPKIQRVKKVKDRQPTLYPLPFDWELLKFPKCPHPSCMKALYWNKSLTIIRCKSKLHKFVLTKKSYEEIVSGKRLQDYKDHVKMMGR